MASPQALRISAAARLFTVLALAGPALWMREPGALFAVLAIALIWLNGVLTQWRPRLALFPVSPIIEAALIGAICGFAIGVDSILLLALAIRPSWPASTSAGCAPWPRPWRRSSRRS